VTRVLAARIAKLPRLHPVGMFLPIFGGRVIPVLAIVALQRDDFAHRFSVLINPINPAFSSNFAPTDVNRQNVGPSNENHMLPVFEVHTNPETVLARFLNIEAKAACVQDIDSCLPHYSAAFIA
jgi:hypothetical protein